MSEKHNVALVAIIACAASGLGCGSRSPDAVANESSHKAMLTSGVSEPENADEAEILKRIPTLADGQTTTVGAVSVEVKRTYHAASGRDCKAVTLVPGAQGTPTKHLTVCKVDDEWAYMPEVVLVPVGPEPDR